ncbi:hypothetical protein MUN84_21875 [Hymenobacter sp. 5516J-16]|uniref:hypothetical protein n=1 Tax=Hymenobacter sp. 5516J-16 TaxID=2932253 RepID=UPI001FD2C34A|nr:hypothetical protein [Hymenobacter sp. 5516J-16]UOQ77068.1 hypothetical protein MUN84_21875 [Hymenobacter sp. 5516J-16]
MKQVYVLVLLTAGLLLHHAATGQTLFGNRKAVEPGADRGQQFDRAKVLVSTGETLLGEVLLFRSQNATDALTITLEDGSKRSFPAVNVQKFVVQGEQFDTFDRDQTQFYLYDFAPMRKGYYNGNPAFAGLAAPARLDQPNTNLSRVFRTYRWNRDNDYSDLLGYGFFEQLSAGPVALLRRDTKVVRSLNVPSAMPGSSGGGSTSYSAIVAKLYLGLPNGNVLPLRDPKDDLLTYFSTYKTQIEQYAKEHKLGFKKPNELAYLVNYANSLAPQP